MSYAVTIGAETLNIFEPRLVARRTPTFFSGSATKPVMEAAAGFSREKASVSNVKISSLIQSGSDN